MKKQPFRILLAAVLCAALVLSLFSPALADLKKGSKGEEVIELQKMMIDLGILKDKADGSFGNKTRSAVKALQQYWGLEATGAADDAFLLRLNDLWHLALGNGTESGFDPEEDLEDAVETCERNESAAYGYDFCYRHEEAKALRDLLNPGEGRPVPDGLKKVVLKRIIEYWAQAIPLIFDEWEALGEEAELIAGEQRAMFTSTWARKEAEGTDSMDSLAARAAWLEAVGVEQCFALHGQEPEPEVPAEEPGENPEPAEEPGSGEELIPAEG